MEYKKSTFMEKTNETQKIDYKNSLLLGKVEIKYTEASGRREERVK